MTNETEPTELNINFETWQAIEDFEALIESQGTPDLKDKWSILKNHTNVNLDIIATQLNVVLLGPNENGEGNPPRPRPRRFSPYPSPINNRDGEGSPSRRSQWPSRPPAPDGEGGYSRRG
jgi:hypothetical protein